jgi:HK97 family phage major capsid protein
MSEHNRNHTVSDEEPGNANRSTEESERVQRDELHALIANIVEGERSSWQGEIRDVLKEYQAPDRSNVPEFQNKKGETVHRMSSPTEPLYRRFPEEVREWRNPDSDHWCAEWIRGQFHKDQARMFRAQAELDSLFRTTVVDEGVAGSSGALSTGAGGALIPRPLENVVMIARDRVAKMRRFANILNMTRQTHTVPTAAAMTAGMVAESTTQVVLDPVIASVQLTARKGQVTAVATMEILDDAAINLVSLYATRAGGSLGKLEDDQFFQDGDGSAPNISAKVAGTAYAEASSTGLAYADVLGMYHTCGQVYRDQGAWFVASDVLQFMGNVRDGNSRPFYQGLQERPGPITDDTTAVGTILNRPVYEVPFTDGEILFGDMNALYTVGTRQGIVSAASEHVKFDLDQVMWKFTQRFDGNNVDSIAAQQASGITSATS